MMTFDISSESKVILVIVPAAIADKQEILHRAHGSIIMIAFNAIPS
jgi:hypothetical protein